MGRGCVGCEQCVWDEDVWGVDLDIVEPHYSRDVLCSIKSYRDFSQRV